MSDPIQEAGQFFKKTRGILERSRETLYEKRTEIVTGSGLAAAGIAGAVFSLGLGAGIGAALICSTGVTLGGYLGYLGARRLTERFRPVVARIKEAKELAEKGDEDASIEKLVQIYKMPSFAELPSSEQEFVRTELGHRLWSQGIKCFDDGDYTKGCQSLCQSLSLQPGVTLYIESLLQGIILLDSPKSKESAEALQILQNNMSTSSLPGRFYLALNAYLEKWDMREKSQEILRTGLERLSSKDEAYQKILETLIRLLPEDGEINLKSGMYHAEQGNYHLAVSPLLKARELGVSNDILLGLVLIKKGDREEGIKILIELKPDPAQNPEVSYLLGKHYLENGDEKQGEIYLAGVHQEPYTSLALAERATYSVKQGKLDIGYQLLERATEITLPEVKNAWSMLADSYEKRGEQEKRLRCRNMAKAQIPPFWQRFRLRLKASGEHDVLTSDRMGILYHGTDTSNGEPVIIRELPYALTPQAGRLESFTRELEYTRAVSSPYILRILDHGLTEGKYLIAYEGAELAAFLEWLKVPRDRPLIKTLILGLISGIDAIHKPEIIVRRLSPQTILIGQDGSPKITGIGLGKLGKSSFTTYASTVVEAGDIRVYQSPEMLLGLQDKISRACDIYSLGAIIYRILAGRPPFETSDLAKLERSIINESPTPLIEVTQVYIHPLLSDQVGSMLAKNSSERPCADGVLENFARLL